MKAIVVPVTQTRGDPTHDLWLGRQIVAGEARHVRPSGNAIFDLCPARSSRIGDRNRNIRPYSYVGARTAGRIEGGIDDRQCPSHAIRIRTDTQANAISARRGQRNRPRTAAYHLDRRGRVRLPDEPFEPALALAERDGLTRKVAAHQIEA